MNHIDTPVQIHDQLNADLWTGDDLKPSVAAALLRIAKAYYKFLSVEIPILDIVVSGSQANYNYTEHSDLDLHLIVDYNDVECDMEVDELFDTKRKLWKEQHDINIYGIPVELYVEDVNKPAVSATYSLIKRSWVKPPETPEINVDNADIKRVALKWVKVITAAVASQSLSNCVNVRTILWGYRKAGLAQDGEYGKANLVFKLLRNSGATGMLLDAIRKLDDRNLSI
jgi:hypothetical protein